MTTSSDKPTIAPLISARHLIEILDDDEVGVVDCRFTLDNAQYGRRAWAEATIPGARYAHLDEDLSDDVGDGRRGRHPLPPLERIAALRSGWGFDRTTFIVCFDDAGGPFAARLWWMLHWIGQTAVAVLDGGWPAWLEAGGPSLPGQPVPAPGEQGSAVLDTTVEANEGMVATAEELRRGNLHLLDARVRERFLGTTEPIDAVAGHIPGAHNMPWKDNLDPDGQFLPPSLLADRWKGIVDPSQAVCYCGSGVTACHNILSAAAAGLPLPRLFAPSWSGWIQDPDNPVAVGHKKSP